MDREIHIVCESVRVCAYCVSVCNCVCVSEVCVSM
jgi:hypothetical protein